jgi:hypothetical protein
MPIFHIEARAVASKYLGKLEADSKEDAIDLAYEQEMDHKANFTICHQCARKVEIGDMELEATED